MKKMTREMMTDAHRQFMADIVQSAKEAKALLKMRNPEAHLGAACLNLSAYFALAFAEKRGPVPAMVIAGSASWRSIPESEDNGTDPTHFTYQYELDKLDRDGRVAAISNTILTGVLPEIHCWNVIPVVFVSPEKHVETGDPESFWSLGGFLVDLSAESVRAVATSRHGVKWTAGDPPWLMKIPEGTDLNVEFVCKPEPGSCRTEACYTSSADATNLAGILIQISTGIAMKAKHGDEVESFVAKRLDAVKAENRAAKNAVKTAVAGGYGKN